MSTKPFTAKSVQCVLVVLAALAAAPPARAASPTYGASAANVTHADSITEGWNCNSPSIVPADRCYAGSLVSGGGGYRKQGNGAPYGDSIPAAATWAGLTIPAPQYDNPATATYILWVGNVGNWGDAATSGGPGSSYQNGGDNFVIFRTPNTHAGRRASNGTLTLMNDVVRPDDGGFWVAGGFIHDTNFGMWLLPAASNWPTGNQGTFTSTRFFVGVSSNGYSGYTWRKIVDFEFNPGNRAASNDYGTRWNFQGNQFVKDTANGSRWIGIVPWSNLDGSGFLRGSAPAMIDYSQAGNPAIGIQLCLGFEPLDPYQGGAQLDPRVRDGFGTQYDFYCYREADVATTVKKRPLKVGGGEAQPARPFTDFVRSFARVTTSFGTHGEAWLSTYNVAEKWCSNATNRATYGYTSESQCALVRNACGPFLTDQSLYLNNRANLLGGTTERPSYYEVSLTTLWRVGSAKFLVNEPAGPPIPVPAWPSPQGDHGDTYLNLTRYDWNEFQSGGLHKEALYVGFKRSHCIEPWDWGNQRWMGTGTAFLNLLEK